jgi:hypothetical protein
MMMFFLMFFLALALRPGQENVAEKARGNYPLLPILPAREGGLFKL